MTHSLSSPWMCAAVLLLCSARSAATELCVETADSRTELGLSGEEPFHTTESEVTDARLVFVPGSDVVLVLWNEVASGHEAVPFYAISLDGQEIRRVRRTSYELQLSYAHFDPLDGAPEIDARLTADSSNELYVVQFVTQPLAGLRDGLASAGAHVYHFVPNHAYVVRMNSDIRTQVEALPYVRAIISYDPVNRLEPDLRDNFDRAAELFPLQHYVIRVFEDGLQQKAVVADRLRALGGVVDAVQGAGFLLNALLTPG